jgi:hypothetical protein
MCRSGEVWGREEEEGKQRRSESSFKVNGSPRGSSLLEKKTPEKRKKVKKKYDHEVG